MLVFANCLALFLAGAGVGASITHWHAGAGNVWGSLSASFLIAVIAAENLRKAYTRSQSTLPEVEKSAG
jgi:hypothetical protein